MDLTKGLMLALAVVLLGITIALALAWIAPLTNLGVQGLHALTDELGTDAGLGWVPYPIQGYEVAGWMFGMIPGLWTALMAFGALMGAYFIWQAIVALFGRLFA